MPSRLTLDLADVSFAGAAGIELLKELRIRFVTLLSPSSLVAELIGKRTWGGLVGRAASPQLLDGGVVTAPSSAVWDPAESRWIAENNGITPDIEIEHDPEVVRQGHDPQLEKGSSRFWRNSTRIRRRNSFVPSPRSTRRCDNSDPGT